MTDVNWISNIQSHEVQHFSQGTQDGVIDFICENIEIRHHYCVEFGFDSTSWEDCLPNTKHLVQQRNWDHLLIDGNCHNPDMNLHQHFITSRNICDLFREHGVPEEPGFISIDLDSTDIWVTDALLENYRPSFFCVEFNPNFPIDAPVAFPDEPDEYWQFDRVMGSSLRALSMMATKHDYSLVYAGNYATSKHHDAFFIRDDLIDTSQVPPLEAFAATHVPLHEVCITGRENIYMNYEVWLETQNIESSRKAVHTSWKKHIAGTLLQRVNRRRKMLIRTISLWLRGRSA
ncbi:MAG: hypothetical protein VW872_03125 [Candidatus Poseidoniales archaeon]